MQKGVWYGIAASFFFSFTFVLNRSMNLSGGHFLWSASLRFLFMLPMLALFLLRSGGIAPVLRDIRKKPVPWVLWSTVGFGLFYAPLSFASLFGDAWFTAAIWQLTIVAGILLTPLFGQKIPVKNLFCSLLILLGVFLLQLPYLQSGVGKNPALALLSILVAAFAYPLGNRKTIQLSDPSLTTMQRVFGMTLCSAPFWLVCALCAAVLHGAPSSGQVFQSLGVALFSGVIATWLFFRGTDLARGDMRTMAAVEATQSGEVVFTLLLSVFFVGDQFPGALALLGIATIITGMLLNSVYSK